MGCAHADSGVFCCRCAANKQGRRGPGAALASLTLPAHWECAEQQCLHLVAGPGALPKEFSAGPFRIPKMKRYWVLPSVKHMGSSCWAPTLPSDLLLWLSLAGSSMQVAWWAWGRLMESNLHPFPSLWRYFWLQQFADREACFPLFLVYPFAQWGCFLL